MKSITVALHEDTLNTVRSMGKNPGQALNTILDEYRTEHDIAAAYMRHMLNPHTDPSPIKRTSIYMDERYIGRLRAYINQTYLPMDATIRILVQDYLERLDYLDHPDGQCVRRDPDA